MSRAALLAWEGYLTSMKEMKIRNICITDIPWEQMEKLTSIVTERVLIDEIAHADQLGSILASVKCPVLELDNMELSEAETRALVNRVRRQADFGKKKLAALVGEW